MQCKLNIYSYMEKFNCKICLLILKVLYNIMTAYNSLTISFDVNSFLCRGHMVGCPWSVARFSRVSMRL